MAPPHAMVVMVTHPNEERLEALYACLDGADLDGFLAGCTDDVRFSIPGETGISGTYTRASFRSWMAPIIEQSTGAFVQHVLAISANDEHGIVLLFHRFVSGDRVRQYRTAHLLTLRNGLISSSEEIPGSRAEFEAAWDSPPRLGKKPNLRLVPRQASTG